MAKLTGGGFTNLPADAATLVAKLERSDAGFARKEDSQGGDLYVFVLEDPKTKQDPRHLPGVRAGRRRRSPSIPTISSTLTQSSPELGKTFRNQTLVADHRPRRLVAKSAACSSIREMRAGGSGALLARSRYLFMKQHRARFGDRTLAELRGVMDEAGNAPFWDALARQVLRHDAFPKPTNSMPSTAPSSSPT